MDETGIGRAFGAAYRRAAYSAKNPGRPVRVRAYNALLYVVFQKINIKTLFLKELLKEQENKVGKGEHSL